MAEMEGRSPPALPDEAGEASDAVINRRHMPCLVAPTPVHPRRPSPLQADMDTSTATSSQQVIEEEKAASTPRMSPSLRARTDVNAVLPVQGEQEDAQAAIDKLDRMQKALQNKRLWLKGTGVEGMAKVATAGGKQQYRRRIKKATIGDDAESVRSLPRYDEEVQLGISSMPGYRVLAVQKARNFLRKGSVAHQTEEIKDSDRASMDKEGEEGTSPKSSLPLRKPRSLRLLRKETSPEAPAAIDEKGPLPHKTGTKLSIITNGTANTATLHKPELTSVKEIVADEPSPKPTTDISETANSDTADLGQQKMLRGPRLMVQCPSDNGLSPLTEGKPLQQTTSRSPAPSSISSEVEDKLDCDGMAQEAAEVCQNQLTNPERLSPGDVTYESPSSATNSDDEGDSYTSDSEGSITPTTPQEELMLNLEHGDEMTKKQKRKLLRKRRKSASGEGREQDDTKLTVKKGPRIRHGTLSNKVQSGLNYASSQSRNRRAMERYTPHPSRPSSAAPPSLSTGQAKRDSIGNLADFFSSSRQSLPGLPPASLAESSRSSTPVLISNNRDLGMDSRRSSMSEKERDRLPGAGVGQLADGSFCMSPIVDDNVDRDDRWGELARSPRRQGTSHSISNSTTGSASFRKRYFSLRRRRQDTAEVAEESDSGANTPREDPEKELDTMLRKLAAEQAPHLVKEQFEYDVLYENQRGIMFFGIPKFSGKTLFQWDPAPWTNRSHEASAYNVVNAQLPNPYWEWVHPEWMIDMTGDVDESGWQYSHNFGQIYLPSFARPDHAVPRPGAKGNAIMNRQMAKMAQRREEKDNTRCDEGLEALKRTARTRSAKWTGIPDQNKYVRRRRWIRLRRRRALPKEAHAPTTPDAAVPLEMGKASGDWSHLLQQGAKRMEQRSTNPDVLSSSSDEESLSDLESDSSGSDDASQGAGSSGFLPRPTPGNMEKGASDNRSAKEQERMRRHAKEFTGTIRELKTLLPAILDRRQSLRPSARQRLEAELWMSEVDARNPFISWNLVKKRLDDDDLAFASTSLRARERRYAQKMLERRESHSTGAEIPSTRSSHYELTKDAVVEINYRRVVRIMKACKVDRHKLQLWKIWLGVEPVSSITEVAREEDLTNAGVGGGNGDERQNALRQAKARWRKAFGQPDAMDVWDLLERRLDRLLLTFEYQGSRASLLRLLLTLHATSHHAHRFRPTRTTLETDTNQTVEVNVPSSISPQASSKNLLWDFASGQGSTHMVDEWRGVGLPRLEFWSDLEHCARTLLENGRSNHHTSSSAQNGGTSPHLGRDSPTPSIIRSSTPQMMGSLANGPSIRRLTTPHPPSPLQIPRATKAHPPAPATPASNNDSDRHKNNIRDVDQSFLAELLQLPAHSQRELLLKSAKESGPESSSVIRRLTRAAEEDEDTSDEELPNVGNGIAV